MTPRATVLIGLALLVGASAGCSKSEKDLVRERTKRFNEAADVLATVTDRDSYEKAKPKLKDFRAYRHKENAEAREKAEKMSAEEKEASIKKLEELKNDPVSEKFREAIKRYASELARVLVLPEIGERYSKEIDGEEE
jgi:5-methylcytosine-specific restriction endonuclease McrBC GTP-binding regulatory subunit McrB